MPSDVDGATNARSADESRAQGRAARGGTPRQSHADWRPSPTRPDPISLLEEQAQSRVPELVQIRYGRMLASPFAFFRGAALVMASDLVSTPCSGLHVQLCGDAHLANFGIFGTPERRLVFDINDFDETSRGPWEWDVKRLAASIVVVSRDRGFSSRLRHTTVLTAVRAYRIAMRRFATMGNLDVWYSRLDVEELLRSHQTEFARATLRTAAASVAKAHTRDNLRALAHLTAIVDGEPRIISDPPLIVPVEELAHGIEHDRLNAWLYSAFRGYADCLRADHRRLLGQYRLTHFARKVVGVGSVGMRAWIALFLGQTAGDPLFLQIKEAQPSVVERFVGLREYDNDAERVVTGQRLMQSASDMFLGWDRIEDLAGQPRDFYVRQLQDWKASLNVERATQKGLQIYARMCGWTLARAHARWGDRIAIAAYLGSSSTFDEAIADFAEVYADQNGRDYQGLVDAVRGGRVRAATGV